jgi:hypothetical protein
MNTVRSWLPPELEKYAEVAYDPTVIISGTITPDHVDEINGDGPGEVIVNLCLNGDGLLVFSSESKADADFVGCYMPPNAWIAFSGTLRVAATHQVLRMEKRPVKLDFNLKKPRASDRIVLCFRFGKATDSSLAQYNMLVGDRLQLEQAGLAKDSAIIDLTTENTALKAKLAQAAKPPSQAAKTPSFHCQWAFKGDQEQIGGNAFTTASLMLKRRQAAAVDPFLIFRIEHLSTGNRTDYFILAVGWIVVNKRNEKHYIVWAMKKDADDESWGVCLFGLTCTCVLALRVDAYYTIMYMPCIYISVFTHVCMCRQRGQTGAATGRTVVDGDAISQSQVHTSKREGSASGETSLDCVQDRNQICLTKAFSPSEEICVRSR